MLRTRSERIPTPRRPDRPQRHVYYALAMADGRWELMSSRRPGREVFAGRAEAMQAARGNCLREWAQHGTAFGIRVLDGQGDWVDGFLPEFAGEAAPGAA